MLAVGKIALLSEPGFVRANLGSRNLQEAVGLLVKRKMMKGARP